MNKNILQRAKGVRDFGPIEKLQRQSIVEILKNNFERFGFNPLETPILERYELFASKFGQGVQSEAMVETFKLQDQGKRNLVLRNEFTVPLARYIGMNPNLKMPFKRYQIGQVFRDGPIKLGRYRQFWQCDVDIVGVQQMTAEAELLSLTLEIFDKLNLDIEIQINSRKLLNDILANFKVAKKDREQVIIILDKLEKIGPKGVCQELNQQKIKIDQVDKLLELLQVTGSNEKKIQIIAKIIKNSQGLQEIKELLDLINSNKKIIFSPSLARGLLYYTGTVFEVFLKDSSKLSSALAGGGRYDEMIGNFLNNQNKVPAVGISFGLETIWDALTALNKLEKKQTLTQLYLISIGIDNQEICKIAQDFRQLGLNIDWDMQARNFKKNLNYANSLNIPFVGIVGENELKNNLITLKNMKTGKQELLTIQKAALKIKTSKINCWQK